MKVILALVVCWLVLLTGFVLKSPTQPPKEVIEREIEKQLSERERELVGSYAEKLELIQKDMGVPVTKRPETIEDMLNALSRIVFLPQTSSDETMKR